MNQPVYLDAMSPVVMSLTGTAIEARNLQVDSAKQALKSGYVVIFERPKCSAPGTDPLLLNIAFEL